MIRRDKVSFWGFFKRDLAEKQGCLLCGTCCRAFGGHLRASRNDIKRWQEEKREDILKHVNRLGWLWLNPDTGSLLPKCPYIKEDGEDRFVCAIHETKPEICRAYPTLAHEKRCAAGIVFS
ncbi:MAG: hypothetical protein C0609_01075 [Deltaproteobacteria bacterium]|nr:MAG: hypothetical protein C0609_01075 [Deltaproteobacteria bacterium]